MRRNRIGCPRIGCPNRQLGQSGSDNSGSSGIDNLYDTASSTVENIWNDIESTAGNIWHGAENVIGEAEGYLQYPFGQAMMQNPGETAIGVAAAPAIAGNALENSLFGPNASGGPSVFTELLLVGGGLIIILAMMNKK